MGRRHVLNRALERQRSHQTEQHEHRSREVHEHEKVYKLHLGKQDGTNEPKHENQAGLQQDDMPIDVHPLALAQLEQLATEESFPHSRVILTIRKRAQPLITDQVTAIDQSSPYPEQQDVDGHLGDVIKAHDQLLHPWRVPRVCMQSQQGHLDENLLLVNGPKHANALHVRCVKEDVNHDTETQSKQETDPIDFRIVTIVAAIVVPIVATATGTGAALVVAILQFLLIFSRFPLQFLAMMGR